ncbi:LacI family DNA-binding transcriptional regulator [Desertihabitans aurantiacus]|uniref:LacI family DNA-binding transcriptional regulator n=1 Tax=Desertihabitans aurantiacus TaxID=2282477 RepID=UPI0018E5486A|nr:LacI family DNA-binding transcriptional regulator [Desertihabitans aurantiacus]
MTQPPTMRDVAAHAGVSPMTVSRTLRDEPTVDPALRARVLAAVDALGYRRNDWARGLRAGSATGLLGLVVTNLGNPFYSQLATGVEEVAAEHGLQVLLGTSGEDGSRERAVVDGLASRRVEGLVVVPAGDDQEHLSRARLHDLPVVLATSRGSSPEVDSVVVDDFGGAREASRQLVLEGHRRTAFLGLPHPSWPGAERRRGFLAGQTECGVEVAEELLVDLPAETAAADARMWRLMAAPDPPTAVLAANNRNTLAACRWVAAAGVPLRVVGFDDIATAPLLAMPVSLVSYAPAEVGRRAAALLLQRLRSREELPPQHEVVATHLVHHGDPLHRR